MSVRIESVDQRNQRLAEEEAKEKEKARAKAKAEEKVKKEKEEAARKEKEAEEKKRKEEEAVKLRMRKEEEAKEQARLKKEEDEQRLRKLADERKARRQKEEEERKRKLEEEAKRLAEEKAQREEAERLQSWSNKEFESSPRFAASVPSTWDGRSLPDPTEVKRSTITTFLTEKNGEISPLDALGLQRQKSEVVDLSAQDPVLNELTLGVKPNLKNELEPDAFPTALATAQYILDLSSVEYPEGIQRPRMDLNENAQAGRFRYEWDSNRIYLLSI